MLSPPGAGKGTHGRWLTQQTGAAHISSGDLLRAEVARGSSLGRQVAVYTARGDLVPDELIFSILVPAVVAAARETGGYVLDGFPRTVEQAKAAFPTAHALGVEVQAAVHLDVARGELVRRLLARRRGTEDTETVIERRLQVYLDKTVPLLEYYADREWMFTVDGSQPADAVHADIVACLGALPDFRSARGA